MITTTTRRTLLASAGLLLAGAGAAWGAGEDEPRAAQPTLHSVALTIVGANGARHAFSVEVAETEREQQIGLMFRTVVPENTGMLFPWPRPMKSQMWMENTLVPLDMVFIRSDGVIDSIAENAVPRSLAVISSDGVVGSTLELQGGLTAKLGISVGDRGGLDGLAEGGRGSGRCPEPRQDCVSWQGSRDSARWPSNARRCRRRRGSGPGLPGHAPPGTRAACRGRATPR